MHEKDIKLLKTTQLADRLAVQFEQMCHRNARVTKRSQMSQRAATELWLNVDVLTTVTSSSLLAFAMTSGQSRTQQKREFALLTAKIRTKL